MNSRRINRVDKLEAAAKRPTTDEEPREIPVGYTGSLCYPTAVLLIPDNGRGPATLPKPTSLDWAKRETETR